MEKENFESHASALKETYNSQLIAYKKTDVYKEYSQYLADFRAKHAKINEAKRPKLESNQSSASVPSPGRMEGIANTGTHHRGMPMSALGPIPYSGSGTVMAASHHHSVGGLPQLNKPIVHRTSPTYHSSSSRLDQVSSTSSVSEESSGTRADQSDALSRTASLSLTNEVPPTVPPIMIPPHRTGWVDFAPGSAYGNVTPQRPAQTHSPTATSATSPASTTISVPASGTSGDWWRERGQEGGPPPGSGGSVSNSLAISQLVEPYQGTEAGNVASRRTLPPLRQISDTVGQTSYSGLGASLGSETMRFQAAELTPIRERPAHEATSQSENEAADVLAGLSERRKGQTSTWSPRGR